MTWERFLWCVMVSKLIGEPVKIRRDSNSIITAFTWRRRLYRILEYTGWWREPSDWWNGRAVRLFVRVNARNSTTGTYELYRLGEEWFLSRVLD
jgi:hypothetical protein